MLTTSRLPLGRAHLVASALMRDARRLGLPLASLTPLGSLRRFSPDIGDVSLLGVADPDRHAEIVAAFARLPGLLRVASSSPAHVTVEGERGEVTRSRCTSRRRRMPAPPSCGTRARSATRSCSRHGRARATCASSAAG
jgi:hypothetical protein